MPFLPSSTLACDPETVGIGITKSAPPSSSLPTTELPAVISMGVAGGGALRPDRRMWSGFKSPMGVLVCSGVYPEQSVKSCVDWTPKISGYKLE